MNIYWPGAPSNAVFFQRPFLPETPVSVVANAVRVDTLPPPASNMRVIRQTFSPTKEEWIAWVEATLREIERGNLQKAVLARCCTLECDQAPDPFAVAAALQQKAVNAAVFCFAEGGQAFLGASPEKLFTRQGRKVASDALAGTGSQEELLRDEKLLREFSFVQTFIVEQLSSLCREIPAFTPAVVRNTHNVSHLHSQITGTLREEVSDLDLLRSLHPTPALCGTPTGNALAWIRKTERFSRGLYGGVVGWSTRDASDQVVAIRSCLIQGKVVRLYTGAGVVAGSDPEKEWEELNQKMRLYQGIFL